MGVFKDSGAGSLLLNYIDVLQRKSKNPRTRSKQLNVKGKRQRAFWCLTKRA